MEANGHPSPIQAAQPSGPAYREHRVPRGPFQLYAREYPGQEPTVVLMHGFPDDLHLYDRLLPEPPGRRVGAFGFLGWGAPGHTPAHPPLNWALGPPQRVAALVLLNPYYARMPGLRPPEAIRAFSTPVVRSVARPISRLVGAVVS